MNYYANFEFCEFKIIFIKQEMGCKKIFHLSRPIYCIYTNPFPYSQMTGKEINETTSKITT